MSLLCLSWLRRQLSRWKLSVVAMPCLQAQPGPRKPVAAGARAAGWRRGRCVPAGSTAATQPSRGERGSSASPGFPARPQQAPSKVPASSQQGAAPPGSAPSLASAWGCAEAWFFVRRGYWITRLYACTDSLPSWHVYSIFRAAGEYIEENERCPCPH